MEERSEWSERLAMYAMDMWEDRPDVKIFVSRRIDIDSVLVDNPLYVPVRCGAVFDKENPRGLLGDNTGDNISEKRGSFCEFTVQYWAWKTNRLIITAYVIIGAIYLSAVKNIGRRIMVWCPARS